MIACILPLTIHRASPTFLNRVTSSLACLVVSQFSTFSHRRRDFREEKIVLNIKCVFWFSVQLLSETFIILRRIQREFTINVHRNSYIPDIIPDFNQICIISSDIRKILKYRVSWKSCQWESGWSMRADRRTDMTILMDISCNFAKAPKNKLLKKSCVRRPRKCFVYI